MSDTAWFADAACHAPGVDPEWFFPTLEIGVDTVGLARQAKAVCVDCPVIGDCLEYADVHLVPFGIWGGLTAKERRHRRRHPRLWDVPPPRRHETIELREGVL